jgi:hypothetical protein
MVSASILDVKGGLFNLHIKTKVQKVLRGLLFADDAGLTAHKKEVLQHLREWPNHPPEKDRSHGSRCQQPALLVSQLVATILRCLTSSPIYMYLGSIIISKLYLDTEMNRCIGKALIVMVHLAKRV